MLTLSLTKRGLKITRLKSQPHLPGVNELNPQVEHRTSSHLTLCCSPIIVIFTKIWAVLHNKLCGVKINTASCSTFLLCWESMLRYTGKKVLLENLQVVNSLRAKLFRRNINFYLFIIPLNWHDKGSWNPSSGKKRTCWLLMAWRRKEPGHQQPWHWPR